VVVGNTVVVDDDGAIDVEELLAGVVVGAIDVDGVEVEESPQPPMSSTTQAMVATRRRCEAIVLPFSLAPAYETRGTRTGTKVPNPRSRLPVEDLRTLGPAQGR
jgi:hypothetical protein